MKTKTLTQVLNEASVRDLDQDSLGSIEYNQQVNSYLSKGYRLIALQDDDQSTCNKLLSFKRVRNFDYEGILVDSHSVNENTYGRINDTMKENDPSYSKDGHFFGLKYDEPHTGYFSESINLFGKQFGSEVWFDRLGIRTMPIPKHIYVKAKTGKKNSYKIPGTIYVGKGEDDPVVYINENTIVSNLPVYVMGKSSDWHLEGRHSNGALPMLPSQFKTCRSCSFPDPEGYNKNARLNQQSAWSHDFYDSNNNIQVTGSIYNAPSENINIDKFVEFSKSYINPFIETGYNEGSYLTGHSGYGYQEGYSHSGYDYLNREEYNQF